jgi:hypothetical protein
MMMNANNQMNELKAIILQRDRSRCQWPGCGVREEIDVLFIVESVPGGGEAGVFENGITLCRQHMDIVNLHEKTFGPLIYDLIRLVEFESELREAERTIKGFLAT